MEPDKQVCLNYAHQFILLKHTNQDNYNNTLKETKLIYYIV